MLMLNHH